MSGGPRLGPGGVVRAAAWPLQTLDGFGDDTLHRLDPDGTAFARAYAAALERERAWLWSCFEPARLQQALVLSSRSAWLRLRAASERWRRGRNRGIRLAERTLYRYLARGAGRATPHGLWAGVAELRFGATDAVLETAPKTLFSPGLGPFQALLQSLGQRPDVRAGCPWRLNPTLARTADGGWTWLHRDARGVVGQRYTPVESGLEAILGALAELPGQSIDGLARTLAGREIGALGERRRLHKVLGRLVDGGLLVGGLQLPARFDTAREALERTGRMFDDPALRAAWSAATERADACCKAATAAVDAGQVAALADALDGAGAAIEALSRRLQLPAPAGAGPLLRCDYRLPWRLQLGPRARTRLAQSLADYQACWQNRLSPSAAWRAGARRRLAERLGAGRSLVDAARCLAQDLPRPPPVWPPAESVEDPDLGQHLRRWRRCLLESPAAEIRLDPGTPPTGGAPTGCLFATVDRDLEPAPVSVSDIPALAYGRFGGLLATEPLAAWVRDVLERHAREQGVELVQLDAPFENDPNVLGGTALAAASLAPWHAADDLDLRTARIGRSETGQGPFLMTAGRPSQWAVLSASAANRHDPDPLAQVLLWTGHHESPGRHQRAVDVPLCGEFDRAAPTPRIRLPGGSVLRRPRWLLARGLEALLRTQGVERFRTWQRIARAQHWPAQLLVSVDGAPPVRIHRDSPLGVEAVLKGRFGQGASLAVSEAEPQHGLTVAGRGDFVVELAVPFATAASECGAAR